jgi:rare lipoprotein A
VETLSSAARPLPRTIHVKRWAWCALWVAFAVSVEGCASSVSKTQAMLPPSPASRPVVETGRASWYGRAHHGQLTASGERFDMHALTAAHPTLPFGTRLLVVNLDNEREVEVRINDRGPITPGRIIDLSYAAARALDAVGAGIVPVKLTVLR